MAFQFESYQPQNVGSILDLIQRGGQISAQRLREAAQIQAQQTQARGAQRANLYGTLGGFASGVLNDVNARAQAEAAAQAKARVDEPKRQAEALDLETKQRALDKQQRDEAMQQRVADYWSALPDGTDGKPEDLIKLGVSPPDAFKQFADRKALNAPAKGEQGFTLGPGQTRFGADGAQIANVPPTVPPVKSPDVGSLADAITTWAREKGRPVETLSNKEKNAIKADWEAAGRAHKDTSSGGNVPNGGLDDAGLELAATRNRLFGTYPARDSKQNAAITNRAAKLATALGHSPVDTILKQEGAKADTAALRKITGMAASAEAFESKANAQAVLVDSLSAKVPRTDYPLINGVLQSGQAAMGSTDAHLFANAVLTFTQEYAKVMTGSTGSAAASTDAAQREAAKLISTALSKGTISKTVQQMQWEMQQTMLGYDATRQHITERMGGGGATPAATNPGKQADPMGAPAGVPSYQDYLRSKGGK